MTRDRRTALLRLPGALYVLGLAAAGVAGLRSLNADTAFYEIAARAGGPVLKSAFIAAVVTVFSSCIGSQACSSRLLYAWTRQHVSEKNCASGRYQVPHGGVAAGDCDLHLPGFPGKAQVMTSMQNFSTACWSFTTHDDHYFIVKQGSRSFPGSGLSRSGIPGNRPCVLQPGCRR
jgi:hypothetical protein